ncbi:MAG: ABC transporter substrate-binding protein [Candidatus Eisenbacteria bacterium]|nr:ABC transporter substrate-binding protein [Candidatus Eisenbacteria bacterium]
MTERSRQGMRLGGLLLAAGLLSVLGGGLEAARARRPDVEFKIATIAPDGSTWMKLMRELDERVRAETDGAVGFRFYPGGQHGSDLDVLRKMRTGQLHGAGLTGVGLGEIEPALRIMELPFLFRTADEVALAHEILDATFEERLRARGFELLGWAEIGFVYLFSDAPVRSAEDLSGKKMWLWEGDPLAEALLDALGVSPVPLNITDVLTSLQTGIVDAVYTTPYGCLSLQWFTRLAYMTDLPITHALGAVVLSKKQFDRLTPAQMAALRRNADEIFARLIAATRAQNDEAAEVVVERNIERVAPRPGSRDDFQAVGRRVWDQMAGQLYERELLDRLLRGLQQARGASGETP